MMNQLEIRRQEQRLLAEEFRARELSEAVEDFKRKGFGTVMMGRVDDGELSMVQVNIAGKRAA